MKIEDVYKIRILKSITQEILSEGTSLSISELDDRLATFLSGTNLKQPQFTKEISKQTYNTEAFASSWTDLIEKLEEDLRTVFDGSSRLIQTNMLLADRWKEELAALEKEIDGLSDRTENLLHTVGDTTGYFSHVQDSFRTEESFKKIASQVSGSLTERDGNVLEGRYVPAKVDIHAHTVSIPPSTAGTEATTKLDLHNIAAEDIKFLVQTTKYLVSSSLVPGSQLYYIFTPREHVWKHIVRAKEPGPMTGTLTFKISDDLTSISELKVFLHTVNPQATLTITPQYSADNHNWFYLPNINIAKVVSDVAQFNFPAVEARYIKLIMGKTNYDYEDRGLFSYEFGAQEVILMNDDYDTSKIAYYQTKPLTPSTGSNILAQANTYLESGPFKFSRVSCEVCEDIPEGTEIKYYVSVDNWSWHAIAPINRINATRPQIVDFSQHGRWTIAGLTPSYDSTKLLDIEEAFPGRAYTRLYWDTSAETVGYAAGTATDKRYIPSKPNHTILSHILDPDLGVVPDNLILWRNVGELGTTTTVRDKPRGWRYEAPYWITHIWIDNPAGMILDLGDKEAFLDEEAGVRGTIRIPYGHHSFRTHESNWKEITSGATDLIDLVSKDPLYPYNHRALIEGYSYDSSYSTTKVYLGVDRWASHYMKARDLGLFRAANDDEYGIYAWQPNVPYSITGGELDYATALVIKIDPDNSDFVNERFVLEFTRATELWDSVMFAAMLNTRDSSVTPVFSKFTLRLSQ